jgi:hypothetical protein
MRIKKTPRDTNGTDSTVQSEKNPTVHSCSYENKKTPRDTNSTGSTVQSEKIPNKKIKNTSVNPLQLGREINKNEMDDTASLNSQVISKFERCVESHPPILSMEPVSEPGGQAKPLNVRELGTIDCQYKKEIENLYIRKADSELTPLLCSSDCLPKRQRMNTR